MLAQRARAHGRLAGKQGRGVSGRKRRAARPRALEWEGERAGAEEAGADHGAQVTVAGATRGALRSVCRRGKGWAEFDWFWVFGFLFPFPFTKLNKIYLNSNKVRIQQP